MEIFGRGESDGPVHTHHNLSSFSYNDERVAIDLGVNAYVVGPDLELQRYNVLTGVSRLGSISPVKLSVWQQDLLRITFQKSWERHAAVPCGPGCGSMIWPTP